MNQPTFGSIVRNNLLALLGAAVVLGLAALFIGDTSLFLYGVFMAGQVVYNLIIGIAHINRPNQGVGAAPYFLSMLLVLIVGYGACTGIFAIRNINGGPPY